MIVNAAAIVEPAIQPEVKLHPNLERVYERVTPPAPPSSARFPAMVRDLSSNGCYVVGQPLPLLSRVAIRFEVSGIGPIDAVGWVLWRRTEDCEIDGVGGESIALPRGFGVLFEAIPLETRQAISGLARG